MNRLRLDDVRETLPELDELRPLFDELLARSEADREKTWAGSGPLGTIGSRLVDPEAVGRELGRLAQSEASRLEAIYRAVMRALAAVADQNGSAAASALLEAAALEEAGDRPERAEAFAAAAHRVARTERDRRVAALALRRWARAARSRGRLGEALSRYEESHRDALAMGDLRGAAEAAIGAGNVLEEQGRWLDAARWYHVALDTLADLDAPTPERWHALLNLHIVLRSSGDVEGSVPWLERAEQAAREIDPEGARPAIENAWGQLLMARGAFAEAERRLGRALESTSGARARVTIRLNLAEAVLAQGRALDAAEHAREAEREAIRARLVPKLPEVYRLLGRVAAAENDPDAFVLFERALEIVRDRGLPTLEEALTLQAYADYEATRGEADTARILRRRALERLSSLGIAELRQPWADVYGPVDVGRDPSRKETPGR
jgi:tetratricopeptide (TPR) repeat protein